MGSERVACRTVDVGMGGMALASPVARAPGQFLRVNFHLNGGSRMLDADAVLVRDSPKDSEHIWGLMFQKLDPVMTRWISDYVEKGEDPAPPSPPSMPPRMATPSATPRAPVSPRGSTPSATPRAPASPQRSRPTPAATTFPPRKRPTPARTIPASPPEPEKPSTAEVEQVDPVAEREAPSAAKYVEPPPPARLSARRTRNEEPPPPARLTSAPRAAGAGKKKSAKDRHRERMEAVRSQRELVDLYREAVKNLRAEHSKKKR
jgi:hypothetical protein